MSSRTSKKARKQTRNAALRPPRPWGAIAVFAAVGLLAAGIIGYAGFTAWQGSQPWADKVADLSGVVDYRAQEPAWLTANHKSGPLTYEVVPSVGGDHNTSWQNCTGDVYDAPIAAEHATHSMEHGAVWITYRTGLPADQVEKLAKRVRGTEYLMLSPHDNLSSPVSLQAWGYQLAVDSVDDDRIDQFIQATRMNAGPEQGASCSGGITATGTTPRDMPAGQQQPVPPGK